MFSTFTYAIAFVMFISASYANLIANTDWTWFAFIALYLMSIAIWSKNDS